ncbi:hypothetical protein [Palleronia caenipelagi]|uniref:hypothetical protein n=1 Tax=Palleronia caenipelagi TaxID=2489174 RepID=UPI001FEBC6B0|nr:hypothetical protein [Palleronia caenipelagi]
MSDRAGGWRATMAGAAALHPISRAATGFHLWPLAGLGAAEFEAAVSAARVAAGDGTGAIFSPLDMSRAGGLHARGTPPERLNTWLAGIESGVLVAMRQLDDIEAWSERAARLMEKFSGHTPPAARRCSAT